MIENENIFASSVVENAEAVIPPNSNQILTFGQQYNLHMPKAQEVGAISVDDINKLEEICAEAKKGKFPFAELFLSFSTLLLGAFLGALVSSVEYSHSFLSILFYSICPTLGVGFGVAYIFQRKRTVSEPKQFINEVENIIERIIVSSEEEDK